MDAVSSHIAYSKEVCLGKREGVYVQPEDIGEYRVDPLTIMHPLLVKNRDWLVDSITKEDCVVSTAEALQALHPVILQLLTVINQKLEESGRHTTKLVLSGGSALRTLLGRNAWSNGVRRWDPCSDYDMYVIGAATASDVRMVIRMVAEHLTPIKKVYISRGVVNMHIIDSTGQQDELKIQMMNMVMPGMSFLYGFDISACSVATDGIRYWITRPAAFAIVNRLVVVDPLNTSYSASNRTIKYFKRLGGMVLYGLPGFPDSENLMLCGDALLINIAPFPCKGNQLAFAPDLHSGWRILDNYKRYGSNYEDEDETNCFMEFETNLRRIFIPDYVVDGGALKMVANKNNSLVISQSPIRINWAEFEGHGLSKSEVMPWALILHRLERMVGNLSYQIFNAVCDIPDRRIDEFIVVTSMKEIISLNRFFKMLWFTEADTVDLIQFVLELKQKTISPFMLRSEIRAHLMGFADKRILPRWEQFPEDLNWTVVINPAEPQNLLTTAHKPTPMTPEVYYSFTKAVAFDRGHVTSFGLELRKERSIAMITKFGPSLSILKQMPFDVLANFVQGIRDVLMHDKTCCICENAFDDGLNMAVLKCGHAVHISGNSCAGMFSLVNGAHQVTCIRCNDLNVHFNPAEFCQEKCEGQEQCALCHDSIGKTKNVAKLQCGHTFHVEYVNSENMCGGISRIVDTSRGRSCPLCRTVI